MVCMTFCVTLQYVLFLVPLVEKETFLCLFLPSGTNSRKKTPKTMVFLRKTMFFPRKTMLFSRKIAVFTPGRSVLAGKVVALSAVRSLLPAVKSAGSAVLQWWFMVCDFCLLRQHAAATAAATTTVSIIDIYYSLSYCYEIFQDWLSLPALWEVLVKFPCCVQILFFQVFSWWQICEVQVN